MMMDTDTNQEHNPPKNAPVTMPNDQGSIDVSGFVKIFDPNTKETIVETRA